MKYASTESKFEKDLIKKIHIVVQDQKSILNWISFLTLGANT